MTDDLQPDPPATQDDLPNWFYWLGAIVAVPVIVVSLACLASAWVHGNFD